MGGVIGIALAYVLIEAAPRLPMFGPLFEDESGRGDLQLVMSTSVVLTSTLVLVVVGALSGLVPAIKASRLDPVEALRYE
jgi:putative ABC transport system permease protein